MITHALLFSNFYNQTLSKSKSHNSSPQNIVLYLYFIKIKKQKQRNHPYDSLQSLMEPGFLITSLISSPPSQTLFTQLTTLASWLILKHAQGITISYTFCLGVSSPEIVMIHTFILYIFSQRSLSQDPQNRSLYFFRWRSLKVTCRNGTVQGEGKEGGAGHQPLPAGG